MNRLRVWFFAIGLVFAHGAAADSEAEAAALQAATRIIAAVEANDAQALEPLLADSLRGSVDARDLLSIARDMRVHEARVPTWTSTQQRGDRAVLRGLFTRADGARRSLFVGLERGDAGWGLLRIGVENPAIATDPARLSVPTPDALAALVEPILPAVARGHATGDFTALYALTGSAMHDEMTAAQFDAAMTSVAARPHWQHAARLGATIDAGSRIDERGALRVAGRYESTPPVEFRYGFVREDDAWRLVQFSIDPKD